MEEPSLEAPLLLKHTSTIDRIDSEPPSALKNPPIMGKLDSAPSSAPPSN